MNNGVTHIEPKPTHKCVRVDVQTLHNSWPWLRDKILLIKHKAGVAHKRAGFKHPIGRWEPEHVRMAVLKGLAGQSSVELYYIVNEEQKTDGFFITSCQVDEFLQIPLTLFIWMGWAQYPGLIEEQSPFMDKLALDRGCVAIEHMSARLGWIKRERPVGYKVSQIIHRKELL